MIKICFVIDNVSNYGGVQKMLTVISNEFSKKNEFNVSILFSSPKKEALKKAFILNNNIKLYYLDDYGKVNTKSFLGRTLDRANRWLIPLKSPKILKKIYFPKNILNTYNNFFEENKFDILIGVTPKYAGIVSLINSPGSLKVGWLHSTYDRYFNLNRLEYWNQEILYKKLLQKLDKVIVLTDSAKQQFDKEMNLNTTRIYNPLTVEANSTYSINNKNLLFVGRIFDATKGTDLLIDILDEIVQRKPDTKLLVVGNGPDRKSMMHKVNDLNLQNNIIFIGETSNVQKYYEKSSILLFPSKMEGFGLVITEAMAHGLPIVSFSTEGPSEIIKNNVSGYLIPNYDIKSFAEKVITMIDEPQLRNRISNSAVERSLDFNVENIINQWIDELEQHGGYE